MAENNDRKRGDQKNERQDSKSIGNKQKTTQTGAQNSGGENVDQVEDRYSDDMRNSGVRNSSNRKTSS